MLDGRIQLDLKRLIDRGHLRVDTVRCVRSRGLCVTRFDEDVGEKRTRKYDLRWIEQHAEEYRVEDEFPWGIAPVWIRDLRSRSHLGVSRSA
jgi:hypothetical protein